MPTKRRVWSLAVAAGVAGALGCTGTIEHEVPGAPGVEPGGPTAGDGTRPGPGTSPGTGGSTTNPGPGPGTAPPTTVPPMVQPATCSGAPASPLPRARLWRLSPVQYANTVKQLFGATVDVTALPEDGISDDKVTRFDTNADGNVVGDRLASVYRSQAVTVAATVAEGLGKAGSAHACVLQAAASDACLAAFAKDLAGKAYRRPLTNAEADRFVAFVKAQRQAHDAPTAARLAIEAMLQSPHFLYRSELGATTGARVALTQHELASQLSYFVADVPPDAALLAAADKGELAKPDVVRTHAERLLALPGARAKMRAFFTHYLFLDQLLEGKPKDAKFTTFTDALRRALVTETSTFIEKTLFDDGGTLETLFSAPHSYQNSTVAKHYGLTTTATDYTKVALPAGRSGLLAQAAVQAALSNEATTSPVHRGLFVWRTMLCRALPPPPVEASSMFDKLSDPSNPTATEREKWAYFERTQSGCSGCHTLFQPLGLGFENFDPIGRWRDSDNGKPIDPSVTVRAIPELDGTYKDGMELARKTVASAEGRACMALQYATFAFGRAVDADAERCRLESMAKKLADGNLSVQSLIVAMTQDDSFYFRRYE